MVEMLLVLVIIAVIISIAVPSLLTTRDAAEGGGTVATLRAMQATQSNYFIQNGRYARLNELNSFSGDSLGLTVGTTLTKGNYRFFSFPNSISALKTGYTIMAVKYRNNRAISAYLMKEDGVVEAIL